MSRLMRENEDKAGAIQLLSSETLEFRRQVESLQRENAILRKDNEQDDMKLAVNQQIDRLSSEERRTQLVKVTSLYRKERERTEELQSTVKHMQFELSAANQNKLELQKFQTKHRETLKTLEQAQAALSRLNAYRDTIRKQELVISQLEKVLQKNLQETRDSRKTAQQLAELQKRQNRPTAQLDSTSPEDRALQLEIERLQQTVRELQHSLSTKRPDTRPTQNDSAEDRILLEILLQKAEIRVQTMQEEMEASAARCAKELAHHKSLLLEKQLIIDTMAVPP